MYTRLIRWSRDNECGCYGEDISKVFLSLRAINFNGEEVEIKKETLNFLPKQLQKLIIAISSA